MFDVVVIGGGPSGATAAEDLSEAGVKFLDRDGRINHVGGHSTKTCFRFFNPDEQLVARSTQRVWHLTGRSVDIPIENGYVGMVDREHFDEFLRFRAQSAGATRITGTFRKIERANGQTLFTKKTKNNTRRKN